MIAEPDGKEREGTAGLRPNQESQTIKLDWRVCVNEEVINVLTECSSECRVASPMLPRHLHQDYIPIY